MNRINSALLSIRAFYTRPYSGKKLIPGIAWFFILLILLCIPGSGLPPGNNWMEWIYFDKWVHIGLFGLLTTLFVAPVFGSKRSPKQKWLIGILIVIMVIVWGYITEYIQHNYISGRSFDIYDWLADSAGSICAIMFCRYFFAESFKAPAGTS